MKLLNFSILLAAVTIAKGVEVSSSLDNHQWIAPSTTDFRSPCPGLNTLANHGYLLRNGRNISIPMILQAALDGFNVGPDAILQAAKFGLLSTNDPTTLTLDALKLHNLVEHDASLSRNDLAVTGDNLHFNETIFSTLANSNPGVDYYNATSAAAVQDERLAISLATNPNITNTEKELDIRTRESGWVQIFFREERLPIAEGWKRPNITITAETLDPIQNIIFAVTNWTATQQCEDLVLGPTLTI
ncbi:Chloroperoxidase [Mycena galopus ATCC 62051]|nr:Chloroperoxidase [Mycena galopus ATCC 62051]